MCGGKKNEKMDYCAKIKGLRIVPFFLLIFFVKVIVFVFGITFVREPSFFSVLQRKNNFLMREFLHVDSGMRDGVTPNHVSINCQLWNRKSIKFNAVAIL